jgi:glycosyltransferase involved in cell wall biosynthesis
VLGIDGHLVRLAASDRESFFVIAGWHDTTMQLVMTLLAIRSRPFAVWTDTPDLHVPRPRGKVLIRSLFLRWIFKRAMFVLGTGQPAMQALSDMGCPKEKLVNFPFFVDLKRQTEPRRVPTGPVKFVSSGRLKNEMKGHQIALSALALARELSGSSNFEYVIAGTGPDLQALQDHTRRLHLERHVAFTGWLEPDVVAKLFAESHILLHPSLYDPFPVAVLEAMAAGLVVLGSDACGSVRDRINNGVNGMIHHAGDVEELAKQIAFVLSHPESVTAMSARACETAEQWPVSRGVSIIDSLLDEACGPALRNHVGRQ